MMRRPATRAKIERDSKGEAFTPHALRDTFATLAILSGKPIGWVSQQLGHETELTRDLLLQVDSAGGSRPARRTAGAVIDKPADTEQAEAGGPRAAARHHGRGG